MKCESATRIPDSLSPRPFRWACWWSRLLPRRHPCPPCQRRSFPECWRMQTAGPLRGLARTLPESVDSSKSPLRAQISGADDRLD